MARRKAKFSTLSSAIPLLLAVVMTSSPAFSYDGVCDTPAEVEELPDGHWCSVPDSRLIDAEKKPSAFADYDPLTKTSASFNSFQRVSGVKGLYAWSGGVLDTHRNRLIVWGGGHNDYGGNEIYAFELNTLKWVRVTDPTPFPSRGGTGGVNPDQTPVSRHTYGGLAYIKHAQQMFAYGGAPDSATGGCGTVGLWTYDLGGTKGWTLLNPPPPIPATNCEDKSVYDEVSQGVYYFTNSAAGIWRYHLDTNSWLNLGSRSGFSTHYRTIVLDPKRRKIFALGMQSTTSLPVHVLDLNTHARSTLTTTGAKDPETVINPAAVYDPVIDRIVAWKKTNDLYSLNVDTGVWTKHLPASTNLMDVPATTSTIGLYGRFNYSRQSNVFVVSAGTSTPVRLYRLKSAPAIVDRVAPKPPRDFKAK